MTCLGQPSFPNVIFLQFSIYALQQGYQFRCATWPDPPYISKMVPIGEKLFKFYGMYADVFANLQVPYELRIKNGHIYYV